MAVYLLLLALLFARSASANNDWSKPCFSGVCEYDLPVTNGSSSGTLKIWGSEGAISDITPAAGWQIINCSPDALQQDIRLVCKDASSASCAHLYSNSTNGAVGKLVRLPENCGKSAFAVVTKSYVPQDQSIPSNIASSLVRRDGAKPTVQGLSLSTSFASVDTSSTGPINFAIRAANVPGANGDLVTTPQQQRRSNSRVFGRGAFSDFVKGAINDISSLNDFNVSQSNTLSPLDVDKTFNLVDKSISCPPVQASVKIDLETKAHAVASIGVAASGTIVPPQVSDFAVIVTLNAEIDGTVVMNAEASGTLDSGKIQLFQVGIPGLDFPGILTIGPSFEINGQATASLDVNVGLTVGVNYKIDGAQLTFPPNGKKGGNFNIEDTPLKLTASPSATATGTVEAHLIPSLNLGISALGGSVDASVFLELDASASMTLTAQAQASASKTLPRRALHVLPGRRLWNLLSDPSSSDSGSSTSSSVDTTAPPHSSTVGVDDSASTAATPAPNTRIASITTANASFSGCFEIDAALDVNAGATASFFGLFDQNTKVALFSKKFEIFKKCFGSNTAMRRSFLATSPRRILSSAMVSYHRSTIISEKRAFDLACPSSAEKASTTQQSITAETISASFIQQL